jgi:hypothetical protein
MAGEALLKKKNSPRQAPVAHACNPTLMEIRRIVDSKKAQANSS